MVELVKRSVGMDDYAPSMGAALSSYTTVIASVFSVATLLKHRRAGAPFAPLLDACTSQCRDGRGGNKTMSLLLILIILLVLLGGGGYYAGGPRVGGGVGGLIILIILILALTGRL